MRTEEKAGPVFAAYLSLHVSVHICLSYLFLAFCFPGNERKHYITATSNNNSLFLYSAVLSWSQRDSHKIVLCNQPIFHVDTICKIIMYS